MPSPHASTLGDGTVTLTARDGADGWSFEVRADGARVGTVDLSPVPGRDGVGLLDCALAPDRRGHGFAHRALRLLVTHAFDDLGMHRVEMYADTTDRRATRLAARVGLRKEGVVRGIRPGHDAVLLARLASDPGPTTREGFRAGLNAGLPRTRAIAQGLIRDEAGRVLMCELVYKRYWDLPGGVVDPGEAPAHAVVREIREELGVDATVRALAVVSWLPPWEGWDDAILFAFEATVPTGQWADSVLERREIQAVHWCDDATVSDRAAPYTTRLIRRATQQLDGGHGPAYLEDGRDPTW